MLFLCLSTFYYFLSQCLQKQFDNVKYKVVINLLLSVLYLFITHTFYITLFLSLLHSYLYSLTHMFVPFIPFLYFVVYNVLLYHTDNIQSDT